ncbi:hypothetical protein [Sulfitobacter aestuariivivens]|uniref:hypothetical protein n=1 Tax=Sulfitobacter aestuariivivens TaxID=2766981 RepID=UPI00360D3B92
MAPANQQHPGHRTGAHPALRRKARAGLEERAARIVSLPKALRLTLARVADDLLDMAMAVIGIRREERTGDALEDLFDPSHLLMLLDGPQRRRAAIAFDPALVGGLIQQETMGRVAALQDSDSRAMTDTDGAICAPLIDALLARAAPMIELPDEQGLIDGYAFGARVNDPRLMVMALEASHYQVLHLTVDLAGGASGGDHAVPA